MTMWTQPAFSRIKVQSILNGREKDGVGLGGRRQGKKKGRKKLFIIFICFVFDFNKYSLEMNPPFTFILVRR
jgi:hypothetical protein